MTMLQSKNVLGELLDVCSCQTKAGFFRDGYCRTTDQDVGSHTICAIMTDEFLEYTKEQGNNLSTPRAEFNFPGLQAGDKWCLCARRWLEAYYEQVAPPVVIEACHEKALDIVTIEQLKSHVLQ